MIVTDYYSRYFEIFKLNSMTEEVIIENIKETFARFGICDVLRSDGGPQFQSKFKRFAEEYRFSHITSSPYFSQSNGFVEVSVKIAKNLIKKNDDIHLALLAYRTTPLDNGFSPGELMMGRKLKSQLPQVNELLLPTTTPINISHKESIRKSAQEKDYNNRHRSKDMSPLNVGDGVWMVDIRRYAKVIQRLKEPRSYLVKADNNHVYRRNRYHLIRAPYRDEITTEVETDSPSILPDGISSDETNNHYDDFRELSNESVTNTAALDDDIGGSTSERPVRHTRPPSHLSDYVTY